MHQNNAFVHRYSAGTLFKLKPDILQIYLGNFNKRTTVIHMRKSAIENRELRFLNKQIVKSAVPLYNANKQSIKVPL